MKFVSKQRLVWEDFYFGVMLSIYDNMPEGEPVQPYNHFKYLTCDQDGTVYATDEKPIACIDTWATHSSEEVQVASFELPLDFDWKESLVEICCK